MTVTVDRRQNLKPHKADFWYGNISENSHTKKYGNMLKGMGVRWKDCGNNERCPRNRLPPDGGIPLLSSCHPFQINDRSDDHVITCWNYKNTDWFISQLEGNWREIQQQTRWRNIELRHPHHPLDILPWPLYISHICSEAALHLRALLSVRSVPIIRHTAGTAVAFS
jgi:hypothetical protein